LTFKLRVRHLKGEDGTKPLPDILSFKLWTFVGFVLRKITV
jgi:hypothetical protein